MNLISDLRANTRSTYNDRKQEQNRMWQIPMHTSWAQLLDLFCLKMKTKHFCFSCRLEKCIDNHSHSTGCLIPATCHISVAQLNAVDVLHKGVLSSNSFSFSFNSVLFQSSHMLYFENMFQCETVACIKKKSLIVDTLRFIK